MKFHLHLCCKCIFIRLPSSVSRIGQPDYDNASSTAAASVPGPAAVPSISTLDASRQKTNPRKSGKRFMMELTHHRDLSPDCEGFSPQRKAQECEPENIQYETID